MLPKTPIDLIVVKMGPNRYRARVEIPLPQSGADMLEGEEDCLGAEAEGESPSSAIEDATGKVFGYLQKHPEQAAMIPGIGPELAAVLVASRYVDVPGIVRELSPETKRAVVAAAKNIKKVSKKAKKLGRAVVRAHSGVAKALFGKGILW